MASDAYKGLTIVIDGDVTKLSAKMREVNSSIKSTQTELKAVDRALKLDPGNVDLAKQKFELASKAVQENEKRLKTLKQAESDYNAQVGPHTSEEEAGYRRVEREIVSTEDALKKANSELKTSKTRYDSLQTSMGQAAEKAKEFGEKYGEAGEKVAHVGEGMLTAATAVATASIAAFDAVDSAEDAAVRKTGATGDAADALTESVRNVGTSISAANTEWSTVGDVVGLVQTKFDVTGKSLDDLSEQFIEFSQNTGADAATTIENVSMAMSAFDVPASKAQDVLGLIQDTSQKTGISVDTLTTDINSSGASFREMGLSLQDSVTWLGNCEEAGIPVDSMLTGLKKAATKAAESGSDLGTEMQDLAKRLQDPATQAQATSEAVDLFGSKSALAFVDAAESGRLNLGDLGSTLDEYSSKVSDTYDSTVDGVDKAKAAFKDLQTAGAEVGGNFAPVIEGAADALTSFSDSFNGLPDDTKELATNAVTATAAVGGLLTVVGKGMTAAKSFGDGLEFLSTTALAGPAGIAVAAGVAAAAIGTGIVVAMNDAKEKAEKLSKATDGLRDASTTLSPSIQKATTDLSDLSEKSDGTAKSLDDLIDEQSTLADTIKDRNEDAQTSINRLQTARDVLDQYAGKTDLTAQQQGQLKDAIKLVNDQCGTQYTVVDAANGVIEDEQGVVQDTTDALDAYITKKQEAIRTDALTQNLTDLYSDQYDAVQTVTKAEQDLLTKKQALSDYQSQVGAGSNEDERLQLKSLQMDVDNASASVETAKGTLQSVNDSIDSTNYALGQTEEAANGASQTVGQYAASLVDVQGACAGVGVNINDFSAALDDSGVTADQFKQLVADGDVPALVAAFSNGTDSMNAALASLIPGFDATTAASNANVNNISNALLSMSQSTQDAMTSAGINVDDLANRLDAAGIHASDMSSISSSDFANMVANCGGSIDTLIAEIQSYNSTNTDEKTFTVHTASAYQNVQSLKNLLDSVTDKTVTVTTQEYTTIHGGANWRGGVRMHEDGGLVPRYHANGGYIVNRPTIVDIAGEAGAEAVYHSASETGIIPLENRDAIRPLARGIASEIQDSMGSTKLSSSEIAGAVASSVKSSLEGMGVYIDRGKLVGSITNDIDHALGKIQSAAERGL